MEKFSCSGSLGRARIPPHEYGYFFWDFCPKARFSRERYGILIHHTLGQRKKSGFNERFQRFTVLCSILRVSRDAFSHLQAAAFFLRPVGRAHEVHNEPTNISFPTAKYRRNQKSSLWIALSDGRDLTHKKPGNRYFYTGNIFPMAERLVHTYETKVRLSITMSVHMKGQIIDLMECFMAYFAFVGLVITVRQFMVFVVSLLQKIYVKRSKWGWEYLTWWNPLPQTSHIKGLYPAWIRRWVFRVELRLNAFPQTVHLWGFSLVWMILWRHKVLAWRKPLLHICKWIVWATSHLVTFLDEKTPTCTVADKLWHLQ